MKTHILLFSGLLPIFSGCGTGNHNSLHSDDNDKAVVAYVTSWSDVIPDANDITHLNYAFGHVAETFDSVKIDNPERLKTLVKLKEENPNLKVLLSVGGWGSGRFSEMAADEFLRKSFATDCGRVLDEYNLDGIDIDWEYPTSNAAGISANENDTYNFTLLMKELRKSMGDDKLLTLASKADAKFIDFKSVLPVIDFVNIMAYDMDMGPKHHSGLFPSANTGEFTSSEAVKAHVDSGLPEGMLVLGMPFYGRGGERMKGCDFKNVVIPEDCHLMFDSVACVPFIVDQNGEPVFGFDNAESIGLKCDYVMDNGLRGAMYWDYNGDDSLRTLSKTVSAKILGKIESNN